uniref:Uncharacterized protein n=1 Tax=Aeromonas taiwanensis TaxID=633417 RepID=A0A857JS57_9GAMM|nr:Hypothetical protein [Aeromonas taiwanensis]
MCPPDCYSNETSSISSIRSSDSWALRRSTPSVDETLNCLFCREGGGFPSRVTFRAAARVTALGLT